MTGPSGHILSLAPPDVVATLLTVEGPPSVLHVPEGVAKHGGGPQIRLPSDGADNQPTWPAPFLARTATSSAKAKSGQPRHPLLRAVPHEGGLQRPPVLENTKPAKRRPLLAGSRDLCTVL